MASSRHTEIFELKKLGIAVFQVKLLFMPKLISAFTFKQPRLTVSPVGPICTRFVFTMAAVKPSLRHIVNILNFT